MQRRIVAHRPSRASGQVELLGTLYYRQMRTIKCVKTFLCYKYTIVDWITSRDLEASGNFGCDGAVPCSLRRIFNLARLILPVKQ